MFSLSFFWPNFWPRPSWRHAWAIFISLGLLAVVLSFAPKPNATHASVTLAPQQPPPHVAAQPAPRAEHASLSSTPLRQDKKTKDFLPAPRKWDAEITIRSGDTLSKIFERLGLSRSIPALLRLGDTGKSLHRLRPGQTLHINRDNQGLRHLMYQPTLGKQTHYWRMPNGTYTVGQTSLPITLKRRTVSGIINRTLFEAGNDAGLNHAMVQKLAHIFGWDIDFALEIRKGDRFKLIWDEHWIEGQHAKDGPILAAEFVNRGQTYQALRYIGKDGRADYYTPDGKYLRKQFLRTPVDFTRISSHFNPRRLHPILKRVRPHRGVDYAAPTGTPVYAAGDGKVIHRGWKGGYGRAIFIQHGTRYATVYAHLSRYARGLRVGSKVTQGQIIGRVGRSGMATGPHLHYEFRVDGVHRNPVKVKLPALRPLLYVELADFRQQTWPMLVALRMSDDLQTADINAR